MIFLRNFDFATKYFDYKSKTEIIETSNLTINGWYKLANGLLSALLVIDNNLYFLYGEDKFLITDSHSIELKQISKIENECSLIIRKDVLVRFSYSLPGSKLNISPFDYIDDEEFRWGEFISKIINDRERKRNFVTNLMECY